MRYTRRDVEGPNIDVTWPSSARRMFPSRVVEADADAGVLVVHPEGPEALGFRPDERYSREFDVVWIGDDTPAGTSVTRDGAVRRNGQVLSRCRLVGGFFRDVGGDL